MYAFKWIVSFTLAIAFSWTAHAAGLEGVMMVVKGDIKVTTPDGKTEAAKVGKKVSSGDTITAGPDSRAKVVMADKNVINVSPDSKIVIEKYENNGKDKNVELNVVYGKVRASVEQKYDGEKNKFNIKTPSAVAGVRGTDFLMGYNTQTKVAQVITFSGSVAVGQPGPGGTIKNPVFVNAGQMTTAGPGKTPDAPKSVPKEDLNKASNETTADTAGTTKSDAKSNVAETKKDEPKKEEGKREPASSNSGSGGGSMISTNDLGPGGPSAPDATRSPSSTGPSIPVVIPKTPEIMDPCVKNPSICKPPVTGTKSKVNIILNPGQ